MASARCRFRIVSLSDRSAMVRATLCILSYALADSPSFSMLALRRSLFCGDRIHIFFASGTGIMALECMSGYFLNLSTCLCLAFMTRALMVLLVEVFCGVSMVLKSMGVTSMCMSILYSSGPLILFR